jgi:small subunit ribosomal protein S1
MWAKQWNLKLLRSTTSFKNVVVSHKVLIEDDLENQKTEIVAKLEKGQVLEGTVKNITDFGVFIDLVALTVCYTLPIFLGAA